MTMKTLRNQMLVVMLMTAITISGCGGGSDNSESSVNPVNPGIATPVPDTPTPVNPDEPVISSYDWKNVMQLGLPDTPGDSSVNAFAISGANIFTVTGKGIFLSADNGESWNQVKNSLFRPKTLAAKGTDIFAGTVTGIHLSSDNGATWKEICNTMIDVITFFTDGNRIFAGTSGRGAYLSSDNGTTWKQKGIDPSANFTRFLYSWVYAFAVSGSDIFASTNGRVFLSRDNGDSWTEATPSGVSVKSLAVSGSYIFAGTSGKGVYLSADSGTSWTAANTGLPSDIQVNTLIVSGAYVFAGTDKGVFGSGNNGKTWGNTGLEKSVTSLRIKESKLFAGTSSNNEIWVSDFK